MKHPTVLLTRPIQDSLALKHALLKEKISSEIYPILSIQPLNTHLSDKKYDASIITSKHSTAFLNQYFKDKNIPIFSIGKETTIALEHNGYKPFVTAEGNSIALKKHLLRFVKDNPSTKFLHIGGKNISKPFTQHILESDLDVTHIPVYEASAAKQIPPNIHNKIVQKEIDIILFFSSRSVQIFEKLCDERGLTPSLSCIQALCLAPSMLKSISENKWSNIIAAEKPTMDAMITTLKETVTSGVSKE